MTTCRRFRTRFCAVLTAIACVSPLAATAVAQTVEVKIEHYAYAPAELAVKVGTTVTWTNAERRVSHSILFTGAAGFESERIFPQESWARRFDKPGTYAYTCGPHPEMRGVVVVTD